MTEVTQAGDLVQSLHDLAKVRGGIVTLDFGPFDSDTLDQADLRRRTVNAEVLATWLLQHATDRRVNLRGARIIPTDGNDHVDLADLRIAATMDFWECLIVRTLTLNRSSLGGLTLRRCRLYQRLALIETRLDAHVLIADGTIIRGLDGVAVRGDGLVIDGSLLIEGGGTRLAGALRLVGGHIGGQLGIGGGAVIEADPRGMAVRGDRVAVDRSLFIEGGGTRLAGALRLVGGHIGGQLGIRGGAVIQANLDGVAVIGDRLAVDGGLFIRGGGTKLEGALRLVGGHIGGQLGIGRGAVIQADPDGLVAIDLSHARVEHLNDIEIGTSDSAPKWRLDGVSIAGLRSLHDTSLEGGRKTNANRLLEWLNNSSIDSGRAPYLEVARLHREAGDLSSARRTAVRGEQAVSPWPRRALLGWTIGYGYQPWRALLVAFLLVGVGWAGLQMAGGEDVFTAGTGSCPSDHACFDEVAYVIETVAPFLDLGQRDDWRVNTTEPWGQAVQVGQHILDATGWALALVVVGGLSGIIRRE